MNKQLLNIAEGNLTREKYREAILDLEKQIIAQPGSYPGDREDLITHEYFDGGYLRKMIAQGGHIFVTKIHKTRHPFFIMKGEVSILSGKKIDRVKAPYQGMTEPGTKRVVYAHTDSLWVTAHAVEGTDPKELEKKVIANSYEECDKILANTFKDRLIKQTKIIIAAEKPGFWSDWTWDQQALYASRDWRAFSKSRGYTAQEIKDFEIWIELVVEGFEKDLNSLALVGALAVEAAVKNAEQDEKNEIIKSSHLPLEVEKAYLKFLDRTGGSQ